MGRKNKIFILLVICGIIKLSSISYANLTVRYSTENYHQSLKDEAGYYIEVVYDNTSNDYIYLSLCGNDIALYEKYFDPLTYLGGAGVKMCKQLKNRVVYGTPGVVGYWIGEN